MAVSVLTRLDVDKLKADRHISERLFPEFHSFNFLRPCTIKILMVTDGGGSFGNADFGLGELIDILTETIGPYARPEISRAHRSPMAGIEFSNFRFDDEDLSEFDEIWMFGVTRAAGALSQSELRALTEFMDNGGGVFATGDHEDLGAAMCGSVPRVRNMRKWHWPNPGPLGEPVAPPVNGPNRHDTLIRRGNSDIIFDDQSDDIPQPIQPKLYRRRIGFFNFSYPHPVLCGPNGPIQVMPDHPHEGECYEPDDLTHVFNFGGQQFPEYPLASNGSRPGPEVISYSTNGPRRSADVKGVLTEKTFGGIGVYDGHKADVGRVLVDATWHHFFNINLVGRLGAPGVYGQGFNVSNAGQEAYDEIKAYFRNIAIYLAPPACQSRMRFLAGWFARFHPIISTEIRDRTVDLDSIVAERIRIGRLAKDLYGRFASRCETLSWAWDWVFIDREFHFSPFMRKRGGPTSKMFMDYEEDLEAAIHGAVIMAIAERFPDTLKEDEREKVDVEALMKDIQEDVRKSVVEVNKDLSREFARARREVSAAMRFRI